MTFIITIIYVYHIYHHNNTVISQFYHNNTETSARGEHLVFEPLVSYRERKHVLALGAVWRGRFMSLPVHKHLKAAGTSPVVSPWRHERQKTCELCVRRSGIKEPKLLFVSFDDPPTNSASRRLIFMHILCLFLFCLSSPPATQSSVRRVGAASSAPKPSQPDVRLQNRERKCVCVCVCVCVCLFYSAAPSPSLCGRLTVRWFCCT